MEADDRFYKMLNEGYRMEKPPLAPSSMYDLMTECWAHDSTSRPTFSTLVDRIGDLMEEGHRQQYVDLNVPYDRMNREWFGSGKNEDYLSKMSGPDFSTSARPTPERGYENVPPTSGEDSGYLVPNPSANNISVNFLSPGVEQPTQYQNIVHNISHEPEPSGQFLANNAGYVFMSRGGSEGPTTSATAPYVKFDIEPGQIPSATNIGYVALGLGPDSENIARNSTSPSPLLVGGISNQSYVPNVLVNQYDPPQPLEQVVEESGGDGEKTENVTKSQANGNAGYHHSRHFNRRQKNDSGLGSIDSNNFDGSTKGDEGEGEDNGVLPSQHNLSYVSHSSPNFGNGTATPHQGLGSGVIV